MTSISKGISRYFRRDLLPLLADLKLAIALLMIIAAASGLGTVIEQEQPLEFYQNAYPLEPAKYGFLTWKLVVGLSIDHVYKSTWFLTLLILFGASLASCTFTRQWPMLKVARRWSYYTRPQSFKKLALSVSIPESKTAKLDALETQLNKKRFLTFREGDRIYARKGIMGKIGPIIVHASMLLVLAGAIWGSLTGFKTQVMIPNGITTGIRSAIEIGSLAGDALPEWQVKVNRFWIDYADDGRVKQFYSDLSIMDEGEEAVRKTIFVNEPLKYKGVTLYQADWDIASAIVRINNSPAFNLPLRRMREGGDNKLWGTFVPTKPDMSEGLALLVPDFQGTALVYDKEGNLAGSVRAGNDFEIDGQTLHFDDLVGATGLQVKSDPGIPLVYAGFGLLMLGVMMSYVSHSQLWALWENHTLYIGGKTNRALVTFEREFCQILDALDAASSSDSDSSEPAIATTTTT